MAYDGVTLKAVIDELNVTIAGGRIEKIYQISKEDLIFNIRNLGNKYKLLISANASSPRIHLTEDSFDNPSSPPSFCMLLRKHLEGFKISNISQYKMDRIIKFEILSKNDFGDNESKFLFVEIMGRHSNIILVDENNKIYDSIKRVNASMSRIRQVLPGWNYDIELISDKINPLECDLSSFYTIFTLNKSIKNGLIQLFTGFSPTLSRELSYRANLDEDRILNSLNDVEKKSLYNEFLNMVKEINEKKYKPQIIYYEDKIIDFSPLDLKAFNEVDKKKFDFISDLLNYYYSTKFKSNIVKDKSNNLEKTVKNFIDRDTKKLKKQSSELNEALDRDKYKIYADLISSNIYKINSGQKSIEVENYYDNMKALTIPLDEKISAIANANKYYKKYSKLKNAAKILKVEINKTKSNILYLESILLSIQLCENPNELDEIKEELMENGYIKKTKKTKKSSSKVKISTYESSNGLTIFCGKNNKQNDYVTFKLSNRNDTWLHVKDAPGSHVLIKDENPDETTIIEAACIAAMNSSLRDSNNIVVDITKKQYVKRHPSKVLGLVTYTNFYSVNIKKSDFKNINIKKIK